MTIRRLIGAALVAVALMLGAAGGYRAAVDEPPRTPEATAHAVATTLRCPTCQGLSVADSPSAMADGMRRIIERQAAAGRTPEQIRAYFVDRYGQWILLSPPRRGINWVVWLLPGLAVAAGTVLALRRARRRPPPRPLGDHDLARARATYTAYLQGDYTPDDSIIGERAEAALRLLRDIDDDPAADDRHTDAEHDALRQLAAALTEHEGPAEQPATPAQPAAPPAGPRWRAAAYTAGGMAFAATLTGLLLTNLGDRGTGEITGSSPGAPAASPAPTPDIAALEAATRARPRDPAAWLALGRARDARGELGAAYTAYRRALTLDPDNTVARHLTAWALIRGKSPEEAVPLLKPLAEQQPRDPQTTLLLGLAQYGADHPDATATLSRYLELAPDGPMAPEVRALLDKT